MRSGLRIVGVVAATGISLASISRLSAAEAAAKEKHCLWQVTNASAPFYLLGSVHALQAADYQRAAVIEGAIKQSRQIFFEIDPKEQGIFAEKLRAAAKLPNGEEIRGKINSKTYTYLRKMTMDGTREWQYLRSWAIAMLLEYPNLQGVSYAYGVDHYVAERARKDSKPTAGLETPDEHVSVFSEMHDSEGEVYLSQALAHAGEAAKQYRREVAAWKAGDTNRLYAMQVRRINDAPTIWWRLLDRRNANWVPKIEAAIKSGKPTLIVAGALHFSGPRSVIALLEQRGYKIEQL